MNKNHKVRRLKIFAKTVRPAKQEYESYHLTYSLYINLICGRNPRTNFIALVNYLLRKNLFQICDLSRRSLLIYRSLLTVLTVSMLIYGYHEHQQILKLGHGKTSISTY